MRRRAGSYFEPGLGACGFGGGAGTTVGYMYW
jgi:hypothetical protein